MVAFAGRHCLLTASTTQIPISISSGEAEFYGVARAASRAIGLVALYADFGYTMAVRVMTDSSAALGIAQRRGCGPAIGRGLLALRLGLLGRVEAGGTPGESRACRGPALGVPALVFLLVLLVLLRPRVRLVVLVMARDCGGRACRVRSCACGRD